MLIKIHKNRSVSSSGTWGTKNENNYEILNFEFPEELEEYNKRIVYYLGNQKVWDPIIDNKAILTNAITTKGSVKAYIWCTKSDEAFETDVDFRTQIFVMNFFENDNADGIVPTEEQIDGFNTMLTAMNEKIEEIDELETTIKNAETQRQENEETRQNNEKTRQENEQTRQNQEAERERRTDKAIADIKDKTAEYNQNAQEKTEAFNTNASQKTNDFNNNYTQKVNEFNSNASSKTTDFNTNAENKTSAFNTNASDKTSDFNANAESKTSAFNDNAASKTNDFNDNASEKTDEFNTNAQNKIDEYDEHIVEYQAQIDELQEEVEELSENMPWNTTEQATEISVDDAAKYSKNKLELFGNTSQASTTGKNLFNKNGQVILGARLGSNGTAYSTDASDYYISEWIRIQPNITYTKNSPMADAYHRVCFYTNNNSDSFISYSENNTFTTPATSVYLRFCGLKTEIDTAQIEEGSTATDYEPYTGGVPSPSPDYPQDIYVVTGNNTIKENSANIVNFTKLNTIDIVDGKVNITSTSEFQANFYFDEITLQPGDYTFSFKTSAVYPRSSNQSIVLLLSDDTVMEQAGTMYFNTSRLDYGWFTINSPVTIKGIRIWFAASHIGELSNIMISKGTYTNANLPLYVPYYHADYPINLGSLELCKIGDYQDYLYKENGNWYIQKNTKKTILGKPTTGNLNTDYAYNYFSYKGEPSGIYQGLNIICSHFIGVYNLRDLRTKSQYNNSIYWGSGSTFVRVDKFNTVEEYMNALSANDITIIGRAKPATSTQITDETLIAQLEAIYNHLALVKGTNHITITPSDLKPYVTLNYMQDLKSKLDNLDSRLSLLE